MNTRETLEDLPVPEKEKNPKEKNDQLEENQVIIKSKKKKYFIIGGIILGILLF
jgi:hypothetical protein